MIFNKLPISAFEIFEAQGAQGDYIEYALAAQTPRDRLAAYTVFAQGEVGVTKSGGDLSAFVPVTRRAGDSTFDNVAGVLRPGTFRYTVLTARAKFYCIAPCAACPRGTQVQGLTHRGATSVVVPVGRYLFVAKGPVVFDGDPFDAPFLFFVQSAPKMFDLGVGALAVTLWR